MGGEYIFYNIPITYLARSSECVQIVHPVLVNVILQVHLERFLQPKMSCPYYDLRA